ncbi:hypothetical protein HDU86_002716 [Geranomyces michiganensis]|nr:hypothetical protein HDU86_002716 [Geranomyces michiganensis]
MKTLHPPTTLSQPDIPATLFAGTLLSVSAYKALPKLKKLLHPRTRKAGISSRKLPVRLEIDTERICEYALKPDGTCGALLAEFDREWVGYAVFGIGKSGRWRFGLRDNHRNDEEDGLERVYEVASRKELGIWSSKLTQPPENTTSSEAGLSFEADSLYSTVLELEGHLTRVPSAFDEEEGLWMPGIKAPNEGDDLVGLSPASCVDSRASSSSCDTTTTDSASTYSSGFRPAKQIAHWNASGAEWETSPAEPENEEGFKPHPPPGAPPTGPLSPLKLRARSRATLKSDVICESIENHRGLAALARMQGRLASLIESLGWLNKHWTMEGGERCLM